MAELQNKLGFVKFIITSKVVIMISAPSSSPATLIEAGAGSFVEAWFKSLIVPDEGLHHLILHHMSSRGLHRGRVPFPYPSWSTHTRAERLSIVEPGEKVVVVIVVVTAEQVFISISVHNAVFIDTVPLSSVAHISEIFFTLKFFVLQRFFVAVCVVNNVLTTRKT